MKARFSTEVKSFSKNFSEKYADIKSEGDTKIITIVLKVKNCVCLVQIIIKAERIYTK